MPIINLKKRITTDQETYYKYLKSSDSYIFVANEYKMDQSGMDCLEFSVGECWFDHGRYIKIGEKGVTVRPRSTVVFLTKEKIALPLNMYGLIFGSGKNIYRGGFVSSGKIDPGFVGQLKIGYYNGSNRKIVLKTGERIGYGIFFDAEHERQIIPLLDKAEEPRAEELSILERAKSFISQHGFELASLGIAAASLLVSIVTGIL